MSHHVPDSTIASPINTIAEAGSYIGSVCFKHGPPEKIGIELEWLLVDPADPLRRPDLKTLRAALGPHTPRTIDSESPCQALPAGGLVTIEPGGQIEISSQPATSVAALIAAMARDVAALTDLLQPTGFVLSERAADQYRQPERLLRTPRYDAMAAAFDRIGPAGRLMMCSTAATQICIDLGPVELAGQRWQAAHFLGPVLLAAFANSPQIAGDPAPAASTRMASWWQLDPQRSEPPTLLEPADYVRRVLDTQVLAQHRGAGSWLVEEPLTLRQWVESGQVTAADIDLHLSMLFPPVRPQGYLELRYLDAQPAGEWIAPLALIAALFSSPDTVAQTVRCCAASAGRWWQATTTGLADEPLRKCAGQLLELAIPLLTELALDPALQLEIEGLLRRRLGGESPARPADQQLTSEGSR